MSETKWTRVRFFGGDKKDQDENVSDYVTAYVKGNKRIEVQYSFTSINNKWYEFGGMSFYSLRAATEWADKCQEEV